MILHTLNNSFIRRTNVIPPNFTGIVEWDNGIKSWWLNGKRHRLGGPAVIWPDGTKAWYINGNHTFEREHDLYVDTLKLKGLL